jgi:hypothetical protein
MRRLLDMWMGLLRYWAGKRVNPMASGLPAALSSRREFLSKNYEMQEGLRQFFAPFHHLCGPECSCCLPTGTIPYAPATIPYYAVDSILFGIYPDSLRYPSITLRELLAGFLRESASPVRRYFKQYVLGKTDDPRGEEFQYPGVPCPALTAQGCTLPWGKRPAYCVQSICGRFLREMDWREHWRYVWLSGRYMLLLTLSLQRVVAEWRHQQEMDSLGTIAGEA